MLKIISSAIAVFIVAKLLSPHILVDDFTTTILVAIVLAFLNTIVKPILTILTIPITLFTMGLFLLAINAIIILFAEKLVTGFQVQNFWWALLFSLILSLCTGILNSVLGIKKES
ncbi:MAG: phage holin family protein [Bacteroidota bacterium]|nr:phage holin family protein [Bacteroidota bacterium]